MPEKVTIEKRRLYELYWAKGLSTHDIAERIGCSDSTLRDRMDEHNVPMRSRHNLETWVSVQTTVVTSLRRRLYEHYWVDGKTAQETADALDYSKSYVLDSMHRLGTPRRQGNESGVDAETYYRPNESDDELDDGQRCTEMPTDPDPSKYLASYDDYNKHRLYELYWGHGHDIKGTLARIDVDISPARLRERFDELGIPRRDSRQNNKQRRRVWRPRKGVPPMYEWPEDREPRKPTEKHYATWRTPSTATGD
jgi:transposase-like protein